MAKKVPQVSVQNNLDMMKHPEEWPCWPFLPIKRKNPDLSDKNLGVLLDDGRDERIVYHVLLFALPKTPEEWKAAPQTSYPSVEAILRDGWEVD